MLIPLVLGGCAGGETVALLIDLATDLRPGAEFVRVRVERSDRVPLEGEGAQGSDFREVMMLAEDELTSPLRVADFGGLAPGDQVVRVRLVGDDGTNALG